jgi:hypothetical protein
MSFGVLALGLATSVVGTVLQYSAQTRMAKEQRSASITAENARRQQMQLDASRRTREAVRQGMVARAAAVTAGVNQGAGVGSSGVQGAIGQAVGTANQGIQTTNSASALGNRVFDANIDYANATYRGEKASGFGSLLTSLGGALMQNSGTIGRLGTYATTPRYA